MKNRYLLLLKMRLYNLFGMNRILHSHNKKRKQRGAALGLFAIFAVGLMITYSTTISVGLGVWGAVNILPTISTLICSLITLILTFLKCSGVPTGLRDYDMVMSLPVKNSQSCIKPVDNGLSDQPFNKHDCSASLCCNLWNKCRSGNFRNHYVFFCPFSFCL